VSKAAAPTTGPSTRFFRLSITINSPFNVSTRLFPFLLAIKLPILSKGTEGQVHCPRHFAPRDKVPVPLSHPISKTIM
jgi:hypothetical protein